VVGKEEGRAIGGVKGRGVRGGADPFSSSCVASASCGFQAGKGGGQGGKGEGDKVGRGRGWFPKEGCVSRGGTDAGWISCRLPSLRSRLPWPCSLFFASPSYL
jgi:hypothetical protein